MQLVMSALGHKRTLGFRHALGYVAHMERRTEDAKLEYRRAIDLNPNFAAAYGYLGFTLAMAGQSDEAITQLERAIHMSPHDPQNAIFNVALAVAHFLESRYPEAVSFARKAVQERDGITSGHRIYIASLSQAGQIEEARLALQHLRELMPNISIAWRITRCSPTTPIGSPRLPQSNAPLRLGRCRSPKTAASQGTGWTFRRSFAAPPISSIKF